HPAQQQRKTRLDSQRLAFGPALALGIVIPFAQLLTHRRLFALHAFGQHLADGGQRARARQHHPEAPQRQHRGLGLAQLGQMCCDSTEPLVETGLAKHSFPPGGCGLSRIPQYAARREARSHFKNPPLMSWAALGVRLGILLDNLDECLHHLPQGSLRFRKTLGLCQPACPPVHLLQHQAQRLLLGSRLAPVEVQAALRLLCPTQGSPTSSTSPSTDVPRACATSPTALRKAWPSKFKVSSTRLAPNNGVESRAARSCRAPKPPVCSANVTVRSSSVLARLCAMSRIRKLNNV